jgi:hypothetical protein
MYKQKHGMSTNFIRALQRFGAGGGAQGHKQRDHEKPH